MEIVIFILLQFQIFQLHLYPPFYEAAIDNMLFDFT